MSTGQALEEWLAEPHDSLAVAEYIKLAKQIEGSDGLPSLQSVKLGVLASCSIQFMDPFLVVEGTRRGLRLETHYGPFAQFEQQVGNPESPLHDFQPDVVLLLMRPEDMDSDAFVRFHAEGRGSIDAVMDRLISSAEAFREQSTAPILVANFAYPEHLPLDPFDANVDDSLTYALARANQTLRNRLADIPGAAVWDYAGLVRSAGTSRWTDRRLWALGRIPVASSRQPLLGRHLARSIAALVNTPSKCLVLDLDNTLWGGVIGDDGIEGIQLGDDYPGNAFKAFQRAALGLADRGILLAVVSKNYPEVVDRALREHPEMLIRPEHLSARRINWEPKSQNLREIAEELNIGLDSLVHFDDNPVERAEIAANAPEVKLVDVPADPLGYVEALNGCGFFDSTTLSAEDRRRVKMYRDQRARDTARASASDVHEFLAGLEMEAEIGFVDDTTIGRVAQLVGKTNQFNLTTRRHSQAEIQGFCQSSDHAVVYVRLRDRFGDLGLIAVGILDFQDEDAIIDTLLMSCRAMGRKVEHALVYLLAEIARSRSCRRLLGDYYPTDRNGIVAELYPEMGLDRESDLNGDGSRFSLDPASGSLEWPADIAGVEQVGEMTA